MRSTHPSLATTVVRRRYTFWKQFKEARTFIIFIAACFFAAGAVYPHPSAARWVGFSLAAYSTVANDSIQTVGTFMASNRHRPWWLLWLFIGGLFVVTISFSWFTHNGDVSYERLSAKGFAEVPMSFTFLQVAAPIFLLIITRMRMPVSTTFLILSCFSSSAEGITAMLIKSVAGYGVAFGVAFIVWRVAAGLLRRWFKTSPHPLWMPMQWVSTGFLWATWIMQDAANIAVYLPRSLNVTEFLVFTLFVFVGLGILFYLRGDKIQRVVEEKADVTDVRAATLIDFVYAIILYAFKEISVIPMSTTWVFIGLLGGREIAMSLDQGAPARRPARESLRLMGRDLGYAAIGLAVSLALAVATNPDVVLDMVR